MAMTPNVVGSGGAGAHLNELLFEALDDDHFVSGLTPVAGELAGTALAAAAAAAAAQEQHVSLPPPALEQQFTQQQQRSDSSPQLPPPQQQLEPLELQRAASKGDQRSGSTSTRGNSGEWKRWRGGREMAARTWEKKLSNQSEETDDAPEPRRAGERSI